MVAPSLGLEIPVDEPENFDEESPPPLLDATPMVFRPVQVVARGTDAVGIRGADPGSWVVVVGQHLLEGVVQQHVPARARVVPWQRIATLQDLQDEDLLRQFMAKQQRMSRALFGTQQAASTDTTASNTSDSEAASD